MIGYLLYEAVEVTYTVTKLLYNGVSGTYYWWYNIENNTEEQKKINMLLIDELEKDKIIKNLDERLKLLENELNITDKELIKNVD
jgi:hypothetical protein